MCEEVQTASNPNPLTKLPPHSDWPFRHGRSWWECLLNCVLPALLPSASLPVSPAPVRPLSTSSGLRNRRHLSHHDGKKRIMQHRRELPRVIDPVEENA